MLFRAALPKGNQSEERVDDLIDHTASEAGMERSATKKTADAIRKMEGRVSQGWQVQSRGQSRPLEVTGDTTPSVGLREYNLRG